MRPFKPPTAEALLTSSIRSLLNAAGFWHWKVHQGLGAVAGVPDILGVDHRDAHRGRLFAIEVKAPRGVVSPAQETFIQRINGAGGNAFVARSIDDVIEGLGLQDRFLIRGR